MLSGRLRVRADNRAMGAVGVAFALFQYAALFAAIAALARLSLLLTLRAVQLWQEGAVRTAQKAR